tara:strand:- start:176 stop:1468 length:1293 start_codon:yes stop_codon:yes gene_type:complete
MSNPTREVEMYILGCMLVSSDTIPLVSGHIDSTAFVTIDHQLIYDAIVRSYDKNKVVDPMIVEHLLKKEKNSNRAGGGIYLYDLQQRVVETSNIEYYLEILKEKWVRNRIGGLSDKVKTLSQDDTIEISDLMDNLQSEMYQLNRDTLAGKSTDIGTAMSGVFQNILEPKENDGVKTGFFELDMISNGFQEGDLIIIAARPSMGKSALLVNILQNISIESNLPTLLFSLEMPTSQIILRMVSSETGITYGELRKGQIANWDSLIEAMTRLKYSPMHIIDKRGLGVNAIKAESRKLKMEFPDLACIAVDYVQLVQSSRRMGSREQEVADVCRNLKILAGELEIPILICSQINRQHERNGGNRRPELSALRESGELEQTADFICFLYRNDYYEDDSEEEGMCEILVKKNRNGPTGTVQLEFEKETMTFKTFWG